MEKIIESIRQLNFAGPYLEYIELRKIGLNKEAKKAMHDFIGVYLLQPSSVKREFIDLVYRGAYGSDECGLNIPFNLYQEAILPELDAWKKEEPGNPIPYRWSGDLLENKKAVQLNPADPLAIQILCERVINHVSMNQHEISAGFGYDGNPGNDIELIAFCEEYAGHLDNPELKDFIISSFTELKACAKEWISRH